jgi:transcriptional regulator with XRE-family HTH domain
MRARNRTTQPEEGIALRKWREGIGIKQSDLAKRAGLSQNLVSLLEAGKRNFTKDASDKIYRAMKEMNAQRAEQLTSIALNRDSRQVALEETRQQSKSALVKKILTLQQELDSERRARQQDAQRQLGPFISEITDLMIERNIKPLTAKITELESQIADLQRLVGLKTEAVAKESQAQDLQEEIEQRVKKGK